MDKDNTNLEYPKLGFDDILLEVNDGMDSRSKGAHTPLQIHERVKILPDEPWMLNAPPPEPNLALKLRTDIAISAFNNIRYHGQSFRCRRDLLRVAGLVVMTPFAQSNLPSPKAPKHQRQLGSYICDLLNAGVDRQDHPEHGFQVEIYPPMPSQPIRRFELSHRSYLVLRIIAECLAIRIAVLSTTTGPRVFGASDAAVSIALLDHSDVQGGYREFLQLQPARVAPSLTIQEFLTDSTRSRENQTAPAYPPPAIYREGLRVLSRKRKADVDDLKEVDPWRFFEESCVETLKEEIRGERIRIQEGKPPAPDDIVTYAMERFNTLKARLLSKACVPKGTMSRAVERIRTLPGLQHTREHQFSYRVGPTEKRIEQWRLVVERCIAIEWDPITTGTVAGSHYGSTKRQLSGRGSSTSKTKRQPQPKPPLSPFTPLFRLNDQPEPNNLGDSSGVSVLAVAGGGLEDSCAQEQDGTGSEESQETFYTICTTLNHILRTDLHCNNHDDITVMDQDQVTWDGRAKVAQVLGQKQDCLTDMVEDMSVVNRILILQAGKQFGLDEAGRKVDQVPVDVGKLLPDTFCIRLGERKDLLVPVSPLLPSIEAIFSHRPGSTSAKEKTVDVPGPSVSAFWASHEKSVKALGGHRHMRYMRARHVGINAQSDGVATGETYGNANKYPFWVSLSNEMADVLGDISSGSLPLDGLAAACDQYMEELAGAVERMYEGPLFEKLLDALLRVLLRIALAPVREEKYMEVLNTKLSERAVQKKEPPEARFTLRDWRRKTRRLSDELDLCLSANTLREGHATSLIDLLYDLADKKPRKLRSETPGLIELFASVVGGGIAGGSDSAGSSSSAVGGGIAGGLRLQEDGISDDDPLGAMFVTEQSCVDDLDLNEIDDLVDESLAQSTVDSTQSDEIPRIAKEPTRSRLRSFQAVVKMLIESPHIQGNVDRNWIKKSAHGLTLTDNELNVMMKVINGLRPYVPKRLPAKNASEEKINPTTYKPVRSFVTLAPFVLIANTLLRSTGYGSFCRVWSPEYSPALRHPIHLDAATLYSVLYGPSRGQFDAEAADGEQLSTSHEISRNKHNIFFSIFDEQEILRLCESHQVEFADRIRFVDAKSVRILGRPLPQSVSRPIGPAQSDLSHNRKLAKASTQGYWRSQAAVVGATRTMAEERIQELDEKLVRAEKSLSALRQDRDAKEAAKSAAAFDRRRAFKQNSDTLIPQTRQACFLAAADMAEIAGSTALEEENVRALKSHRYFWLKVRGVSGKDPLPLPSQGSGDNGISGQRKSSNPTAQDRRAENFTENVDLSNAGFSAQAPSCFLCTDPGLSDMHSSVAMTGDDVHLRTNRYFILSDAPNDNNPVQATAAKSSTNTPIASSTPASPSPAPAPRSPAPALPAPALPAPALPAPAPALPAPAAARPAPAPALPAPRSEGTIAPDEAFIIPATIRTRAEHINHTSFSNKALRRRERRLHKPEAKATRDAIEDLSLNSIKSIMNGEDLVQRHHRRKSARKPLREFARQSGNMRDRQTRELRTKQAWAGAAARERRAAQEMIQQRAILVQLTSSMPNNASDLVPTNPLNTTSSSSSSSSSSASSKPSSHDKLLHESMTLSLIQSIYPGHLSHSQDGDSDDCSDLDGLCMSCDGYHMPKRVLSRFEHPPCSKTVPKPTPIILYGAAGTGVGLRIGGHARRGGGKMRKEHRMVATVCFTNENRTSKLCSACYHPIRLAPARRIIKGALKVVRLHGAVLCTNPACPLVRLGRSTNNRDNNAATNIGVSGATVLSSPRHLPLPPFRSYDWTKVPTSTTSNTLDSITLRHRVGAS